MNNMTQEEFKAYLVENGIDDQHEAYDDLWFSFLSGKRSPNAVYNSVNQNCTPGLIEDKPEQPETSRPSEWDLRGSITGE